MTQPSVHGAGTPLTGAASRHHDLPLEEVSCYLCQRRSGRILVEDPPFRIILCDGCGLAYSSPRVAAAHLHEIYSDEYFNSTHAEQFGYTSYSRDFEAYERTFKRKTATIVRHKPKGRVLEVGCAAGAFLKAMHDREYDVLGIEVCAPMAAAARSLGFTVFEGRIDDVALTEGTFDIVALFDVIEHLPDPLHELARCRELLAGDGILVIQTQDVDSWARRLMGRHWHHFKQPEHVLHFSPRTLRVLLERAGFRVLELTRRHAGKYVSLNDVADRAHRLLGVPRFLCQPLRLIGRRFVYVNPLDEMLVIAAKAPPTERVSGTGK